MLRQKSLVEKVGDNIRSGVQSVRSATSNVTSNVNSASQSATESLNNIKGSINRSVENFSNTKWLNASKEFLSSNSILAKFTFIILILIGFMIVFRVCVLILQYFFAPSTSPYIVYGTLDGSDKKVLFQDRTKSDSVTILRSNNRHGGAEFTYSVWLFLRPPNASNSTANSGSLKNVFVKGAHSYDSATGVSIVNGPGMYLKERTLGAATEYDLHVVMDHIGDGDGKDEVVVDSLPIGKWFHVAVRLQNMMLDVYVNGTIAKRQNLEFAPKQNFYDVVVNGNNGFSGQLSNLRYYNRALNIFEMNNIVMWGPNTNKSSLSTDSRAKTGNYSYLSSLWYSSKY